MKRCGKWEVHHTLRTEYKEEYSKYNKLNENIRIPIINTETNEKVEEFCLCSIVDSKDYMILKIASVESILFDVSYNIDIKLGDYSILAGDQICNSNMSNNILLDRSNVFTNKIRIELSACDANGELENMNGSLDVLLGNMVIEETEPTPIPYSLEWRGLKFNWDNNKFEVSPNATDDYGNRYYLSFYIKEKISQNDYRFDHIEIVKYKNELNYNLEELCLEYEKIINAGVNLNTNKTQEEYIIYEYDEEDNTIKYLLTKEQLYDFAEGKEITVDGKTISRKLLYGYDEYKELRNKEIVKIAGYDAITFVKEEYYTTKRYYLIIVDDMVYEIIVPTTIGPYLSSKEFIEKLEIIK